MEGEHDVHRIREQLPESQLVHAVWVVLRPRQRHQVDHVDDADFELGQLLCFRMSAAATVSIVTTSPAHASTMSGSESPSSLPAHSQTEAPLVQCSIASIVRYCNCGCLSMTIRFR